MIRISFKGGCMDGEERLYTPEEYDRLPHAWHAVISILPMSDLDRTDPLPAPDVDVYRLVFIGSDPGGRLFEYRFDHRVEEGGSLDGRVRRDSSIEVQT